MSDSTSRKKGCWLTDHADIAVPPSRDDFIMAGNLHKRRGGFGKMSQQRWKNRCFVLLKTGNLCYFEAGSFDSVNFCDPPRGILTLDEDFAVSKSTRPDGDYAGGMTLVIQSGGERWKLSSEVSGEINRWEEALRSMMKRPGSSSRIAVHSMRSPTFDPRIKNMSDDRGQSRQSGRRPASTNGTRPRSTKVTEERVGGEANKKGLWDFLFALTVVDVACYLLHKHEASDEAFYAVICLVNLVVGSRVLRRAWSGSRHEQGIGVPLIHEDDVIPLKSALKRRFPARIDSQPLPLADVVDSGVPRASSTMQQYYGAPGSLTAPPHSWSNGISTVFRVRGKDYLQDKIKVVPDESLYEMVGMDTFATEARVGNMASEIVLDSVTKDLPHVASAVVPPLLVINVQLPSAPPALMSSAEDGPGYQDSTVRALENLESAAEGVRLWVAYCEHIGVDEDFHGRFKCIAVIANSESLGLPTFVTKYNGKPVLINRSGNWVRGDCYIENTINVHRFSFIAKKSLHTLKALFKDMVLHIAFTIEGRSPGELPESILACSTLNYPLLERAVEFDEDSSLYAEQ